LLAHLFTPFVTLDEAHGGLPAFLGITSKLTPFRVNPSRTASNLIRPLSQRLCLSGAGLDRTVENSMNNLLPYAQVNLTHFITAFNAISF